MEREATSTNYTIPVTEERLLEIMRNDDERLLNDTLSYKLDRLDGVYDTNYDGCFGAAVFIRLDTEYDTDTNWKAIEEIILKG